VGKAEGKATAPWGEQTYGRGRGGGPRKERGGVRGKKLKIPVVGRGSVTLFTPVKRKKDRMGGEMDQGGRSCWNGKGKMGILLKADDKKG